MKMEGLPKIAIDSFLHYYDQVVSGKTGLICDSEIRPIDPAEIESYKSLRPYIPQGYDSLSRSARIVLNGGLGTSMGLTSTKSLLKVKNGKSFLEIILQQADHQKVQLVLMNSYNTHEETVYATESIKPSSPPLFFLQHKFPKILKDTLAPADWPDDRALEWNPPGHGNLFIALETSGTLQRLLDNGIQYAFVSNADNLGADMDLSLLGYFVNRQFPFMMEVAQRTPADIKGGHLARHRKGHLILRESAQCPRNELKAFQDIGFYRYFNTNNIWLNLLFIKQVLEKEGNILLPLILNSKTVDPRDEMSPAVFQIESAIGAAISIFPGASAVIVPKDRLIPVKKCNDLLLVMSDCFILSPEGRLVWNKNKKKGGIRIDLDPKFYAKIDQLKARFPDGAPSLSDCEELIIIGDVRFESNVTIQGSVKIENHGLQQAVIKKDTLIERNLTFY